MEDYLFGIGEPYFGQSHLTSDHMSSYEEQAFSLCKYEFISTVNPNQLVREMRRRLTLPRQAGKTFLHLEKKGLDRERICCLLFQILPLFSNLQNLVICLERCKYNNLATTLFWNLFKVRTKVLVVIQRVSPEQRQGLQEFSRKLKRSVHNAPFGNRSIFLRRLAKIYVKRIEKEHDPYKRQTFADKYITIIAAEIDVHAIEFNTNLHNSSMFSHMKYVISETSNTLVTDIGYFGRLANAYAIAGKYSDSEDMLKEARCRSLNIGPGLELFNLLYTEVYVRLWQFETFPTPDLRDALLFWGRLGLKSLEEDDDIYSLTIWKRNLIMRMVFCLLGLGNRGNVIEKCVVSDNCIKEACHLLEDFERYLDGIETRRLMLYGLAKARLFEIKDKDYVKCLERLKEAKHYAETGRFKELHFINEYYTRIFKMVQQPNTPFCHSFKLQHELPNDNYAMLQPPFTTQYLDLCGRTPEENNNAMMRLPCSTPSFHSYIPMSKEISNCHMIQSACSTPSFHSYWPLQDESCNYVTAESSSSTPYFYSSLPQSEGNGNPLILQPVSLAPSFHSLRLQDETMGNYVMSQSLCTTPSFHSLRPQEETMGNWLMLHSLCTTPSFHSCMPQNETSGNYVLLQSSISTFSFHSFWPQNGIMPFNDCKTPNNDFNCGHLNSLLGERNSDMFYVERGEPSGCSQPETNILPSHTGGFNCYTDISTSVKSCVPGVQLEGNNTNMKLLYNFQGQNNSTQSRENDQPGNATDRILEMIEETCAPNFINSSSETTNICAGETETNLHCFTDSLFEACDNYDELLNAALCKYTKHGPDLGDYKAQSYRNETERRSDQQIRSVSDNTLSSLIDTESLMSFRDFNINTEHKVLRCPNGNDLAGFIHETVKVPSFERPPLSGCSGVGDRQLPIHGDGMHQESNRAFCFANQLISNGPANAKCNIYDNTESLSISSDDMFGE